MNLTVDLLDSLSFSIMNLFGKNVKQFNFLFLCYISKFKLFSLNYMYTERTV